MDVQLQWVEDKATTPAMALCCAQTGDLPNQTTFWLGLRPFLNHCGTNWDAVINFCFQTEVVFSSILS